MYLFLSSLCGLIVTVMSIFNGQLSDHFGIYVSTVLIHMIGLCTMIIVLLIKQKRISFHNRVLPVLYLGGVVGVFTVVFQVFSISSIGVALLTALGLLGQMLMSILLEYKGWFGTMKRKMNKVQLLSLVIVVVGIGVMIL